MTSTDAADGTQLWKTATGTRAHLAQCSHLVGKAVVAAGPEPVCDLSQAELEGRGRDYLPDVGAALQVMGVSGSDWSQVHALLASVTHDAVWLPYSRSYIALGHGGQGVAWVGKNYVDIAGQGRTELPGYAAAQRSAGVSQEPKYGPTCPRCFLATPVGGQHDCY